MLILLLHRIGWPRSDVLGSSNLEFAIVAQIYLSISSYISWACIESWSFYLMGVYSILELPILAQTFLSILQSWHKSFLQIWSKNHHKDEVANYLFL